MSAASAPAAPTAKPQPVIDVAQHLVRLAASCMAKLDIRYYLKGVYIEPREAGGVFIVGCDGHRLMAVIDETGVASEAAILHLDRATVQRLARPSVYGGPAGRRGAVIPKEGGLRLQTEQFRGDTAMVLTDSEGRLSHVRPSVLVEGKFPDWRRVIPDFDKMKRGVTDAYNPNYLMEPLSTFASRSGRSIQAYPYQAHEGGGIVWHMQGHEYALLLIMPQRGDAGGLDVFKTKWNPDARRPRQLAKATAEGAVAVPAERGAAQAEGPAEADAQRAAAEAQAEATRQGTTG